MAASVQHNLTQQVALGRSGSQVPRLDRTAPLLCIGIEPHMCPIILQHSLPAGGLQRRLAEHDPSSLPSRQQSELQHGSQNRSGLRWGWNSTLDSAGGPWQTESQRTNLGAAGHMSSPSRFQPVVPYPARSKPDQPKRAAAVQKIASGWVER